MTKKEIATLREAALAAMTTNWEWDSGHDFLYVKNDAINTHNYDGDTMYYIGIASPIAILDLIAELKQTQAKLKNLKTRIADLEAVCGDTR